MDSRKARLESITDWWSANHYAKRENKEITGRTGQDHRLGTQGLCGTEVPFLHQQVLSQHTTHTAGILPQGQEEEGRGRR